MTARGKQVKLRTLSVENEIFVYDRRVISPTATDVEKLLPRTKTPTVAKLPAAPDFLADNSSLQAWQALFRERQIWAANASDATQRVIAKIQKLDHEIKVVQRGAAIAVENVKQHLGNLRPKYENSKSWAAQALQDQNDLLGVWETVLGKLNSLPISHELGQCLQGSPATGQKRKAKASGDLTLRDFVSVPDTKTAAHTGQISTRRFGTDLNDLNTLFEDVVQDADEVIENFSRGLTASDSDTREQASQLLEEVEVLAQKVKADHEQVLGLPESQRSISQASKVALSHTNHLLPVLRRTFQEVEELLQHTAEKKDQAMTSGAKYMRRISTIESSVAHIHARLAKLDINDEDSTAFEALDFVTKLPSVYGALLTECVRRREWTEKITIDSSTLVEEMATVKEDEIKRRKRWVKELKGFVSLEVFDDMSSDIEINIKAQKDRWPDLARQNIFDYVQSLRLLGGFDDAVQDVDRLVKELDMPTRQHARRAKAFKNGSIHEAAFGGNSLLLLGDNELLKTASMDKSKLEDKLKSAESRIRKLEDLLHRQSQVSRPSSNSVFTGNNGPVFERHATSPVLNHATLARAQGVSSRRSSGSSRRFSTSNDSEEKALAKRVLNLEAELNAEKVRSADLQRDAAEAITQQQGLKQQMQDAVSTKEDLMGNMEAQQREFDGERRLLEDESSKLKIRLEELEDELDRAAENHERDDKIATLKQNLRDLSEASAAEEEKLKSQLEHYKSSFNIKRDLASQLEEDAQRQGKLNADLRCRVDQLAAQLETNDRQQQDHQRIIAKSLGHLRRDESPTADLHYLLNVVETATRTLSSQLHDTEKALESKNFEASGLEQQIEDAKDSIRQTEERSKMKDNEISRIQSNLMEHNENLIVLEGQLHSERDEHGELQSNHETLRREHRSLRERMSMSDEHATELSIKLQAAESKLKDLEDNLASQEGRRKSLEESNGKVKAHQRMQATRAEEISRRLNSQINSLGHVLEQIRLTVTKQDDNSIVIQKIPRAKSIDTSIALNDPSASMNRSLSGPLPTKSTFEDPTDPSIFQWASTTDPSLAAEKFDAYIHHINTFDTTAFSDAIIKRVKEAEHTARKWQREARAYREKSHRAQGEAREKVALRSFKEGDLALFLPTRNQATRPWAAFNVGAPHCFLREQDHHNLRSREWLLARITKVEERVVDLSKSINGLQPPSITGAASDHRSLTDKSDCASILELSDGLRCYLLYALE